MEADRLESEEADLALMKQVISLQYCWFLDYESYALKQAAEI